MTSERRQLLELLAAVATLALIAAIAWCNNVFGETRYRVRDRSSRIASFGSNGTCAAISGLGLLSGNYICVDGEGTKDSKLGSLSPGPTFPSYSTAVLCPTGTRPPVPAIHWTGAQGMMTPGVAAPSGSFSACYFGKSISSPAEEQHWLAKDKASGRGFFAPMKTDGVLEAYIWNPSGTLNSISVDPGVSTSATTLVCAVYNFVGDGTSTLSIYTNNGVQRATKTDTVGPMRATATTSWTIGMRAYFDPDNEWIGDWRFLFLTEKALSVPEIQSLFSLATAGCQ